MAKIKKQENVDVILKERSRQRKLEEDLYLDEQSKLKYRISNYIKDMNMDSYLSIFFPFYIIVNYYYYKSKTTQEYDLLMDEISKYTIVTDSEGNETEVNCALFQTLKLFNFVPSKVDMSFNTTTVIPADILAQTESRVEKVQFVSTIINSRFGNINNDLAESGVFDIVALEHRAVRNNIVLSSLYPISLAKLNECKDRVLWYMSGIVMIIYLVTIYSIFF